MQLSLRPIRKRAALLWLPLLVLLLVWILQAAPLNEILATLGGLSLSSLLLLLAVNLAIFLMLSSRWWLILRSLGYKVPFFSLSAYRLAAFSITYFTPGTQMGGEPFQIYLLRARQQIPGASALASVSLDKLLELLVNFIFLVFGLLVILDQEIFSTEVTRQMLFLAVILLTLPGGYLIALWNGRHPLSWLTGIFPRSWGTRWPVLKKILTVGKDAESKVSAYCQENPRGLLATMGLSLLIWVVMILEFYLSLRLLGLPVQLPQAIMALTAARLAFLLPLPAGIGALEASQVLALQAIGFSPAVGISVALLIRGRDLLLAGAGLWLAGILSQAGAREPKPKELLPSQAGD